MKQHITPEQIKELDEWSKTRLMEWWYPSFGDHFTKDDEKDSILIFTKHKNPPGSTKQQEEEATVLWKWSKNTLPLLSIGQMIEFLGDDWWKEFFTWSYGSVDCEYQEDKQELCDALWKSVKDVLEQQ